MIHLSKETEALAEKLAMAQKLPVEVAIRQALEEKATAAGIASHSRRRMSIENMLAVGDEIASMPLLDSRSPQETMDDLNVL